jgi:hypothetical protein
LSDIGSSMRRPPSKLVDDVACQIDPISRFSARAYSWPFQSFIYWTGYVPYTTSTQSPNYEMNK